MSLTLLHCRPDPYAFATWAQRHHLLSPDGDDGYALHALLSAALGGAAPRPFRYLSPARGLLGYCRQDASAVQDAAALAPPDLAAILNLDALAVRPFPETWRTDQRLDFEATLRPVVRTANRHERDAFLHRLESIAGQAPAPPDTAAPGREAVYREWLTARLGADGAADLLSARMDGFRLARVLRRPAGSDGQRRQRVCSGPVAHFSGTLQIRNPAAFARLIATGIGRHRAFGFGMLLVRPARTPC